MEFLTQNAEGIGAFVALVVGFVWTIVKGTDWWAAKVGAKKTVALESIGQLVSVVVNRTYLEKVKDMKKPGEKLSTEQVNEIRSFALDTFKAEGKARATKLIKDFGENFIRAKIEDAYKTAKAKGMAVKATIPVLKPDFGEEKDA